MQKLRTGIIQMKALSAIYHIHRDKEEKKIEKVVKRVILLYVPDADLICST